MEINVILSALQSAFADAIAKAVASATAPLVERIAALEQRMENLENNPAIGVDTTLERRVAALETKLTEANLFTQNTNVTIPIDEAKMVEALNSQEWFWEKLQNRIDAAAEAAMDDHLGTYDHDEYDNHINDDDKHFDGDIEDAVRDALNGTSVTLSF